MKNYIILIILEPISKLKNFVKFYLPVLFKEDFTDLKTNYDLPKTVFMKIIKAEQRF